MNSPKVFDAHMHIIDKRFPLTVNQGFLPDEFTCRDYLDRLSSCNLVGGAVVSGSFQGFDQTYLAHALQTLGPAFVGVTQLPATTTDEEVLKLAEIGVRAVRFNIKRGGSENIMHLDRLARRVYELAMWHVELYVDAKELPDLTGLLSELPAVSIDHLGLSQEGFPALLHLVEKGAKVKATGFGRVDFDVCEALHAIYGINPKALMFGTDLPSTRAPRSYSDQDMQLICDTFDEVGVRRILCENAMELYLHN